MGHLQNHNFTNRIAVYSFTICFELLLLSYVWFLGILRAGIQIQTYSEEDGTRPRTFGAVFGILANLRHSLRPGMIQHVMQDSFAGIFLRLAKHLPKRPT
jgi:hypothetical protein